jgi:hypothetical protein
MRPVNEDNFTGLAMRDFDGVDELLLGVPAERDTERHAPARVKSMSRRATSTVVSGEVTC